MENDSPSIIGISMTRREEKQLSLMIVAGEPSGDAHAAALVRALRDTAPAVHFEVFGATGPLMRAAGV